MEIRKGRESSAGPGEPVSSVFPGLRKKKIMKITDIVNTTESF